MLVSKTPVNRADDGELLGFVVEDASGWQAQTIFGYSFARAEDRASVEQVVRDQGLTILGGLWQYFDEDDKTWHPCVIKEAAPNQVIIIRTNEMGYQDPDSYKYVVIKNPDETRLIQAQ